MKQTVMLDDWDGSPADVTLEMVFEGDTYTWDLSNANADKLRKALKPWLNKATKKQRRKRRTKAEMSDQVEEFEEEFAEAEA